MARALSVHVLWCTAIIMVYGKGAGGVADAKVNRKLPRVLTRGQGPKAQGIIPDGGACRSYSYSTARKKLEMPRPDTGLFGFGQKIP